MEKKKIKLTISGNKKKTIDNIELAKLQNKNSVVIEKKTSRFGSKTSFKISFGDAKISYGRARCCDAGARRPLTYSCVRPRGAAMQARKLDWKNRRDTASICSNCTNGIRARMGMLCTGIGIIWYRTTVHMY